jgi:hypothetical protein
VAEADQRCTHPWLRVTCGVCGLAVDALGAPPAPPADGRAGAPRDPVQGLFIVARGHSELVEQLRAVLGHDSGVEIIEDRRRRPRDTAPDEPETRALRRRLRHDGEPHQG